VWLLVAGAAKASQAELEREKKNAQALEAFVPQAAERDPAWREADLLAQAKDAFMAVQNAWTKRDMDLARDAATDKLYEKHRSQLEMMIYENRENVLEAMTIRSARIVRIADHLDDARDEVWVKFAASAIDYTVDTHSGRVIEGDRSKPDFFTEIWVFKRRGDAWLADEILQESTPIPASVMEGARTR
jgi:predicted lipid-binding transport protein (Tim44 family)